jgi:hypothetical protein
VEEQGVAVEEGSSVVDDTPIVVDARDFPEIVGISLLRIVVGTP